MLKHIITIHLAQSFIFADTKRTHYSAVTFVVPLALLALIIISVTLIVGVKHHRNRQRFVTETVHTSDKITGLAETGMEQLGDGHALNLREGKPSHKINGKYMH